MQNRNMALLTQGEIDALVNFLTSNNSLNSNVLDQEHIDKLIQLLQNAAISSTILTNNHDSQIDDLVNRDLKMTINTFTNYIELFAYDKYENKIMITPNFVKGITDIPDDSTWGYTISPSTFYNIANQFKMQYSTETYATVCKRFAINIYGDPNFKIPAYFLPDYRLTIGK